MALGLIFMTSGAFDAEFSCFMVTSGGAQVKAKRSDGGTLVAGWILIDIR